MAETDIWLAEFGERHKQVGNPVLYWASLLLLFSGTTGIFWSLPSPNEFAAISPLLNWGSAFLMASVVYYFVISTALAIGMVPFIFCVAGIQMWLASKSIPITVTSSVLAGAGVAGLSLCHFAAGGMRAVMRDVQLIMIAPLWLLSILYRRLGIPF